MGDIESFRARKSKGYFEHYVQPYAALAPINFIEEITKPITLTFRLFGNLFSGRLMILVMATLLPIYVGPFGEIIWKPFDLFIGAIQAFIFMLLTVMYFGMARATKRSTRRARGLSLTNQEGTQNGNRHIFSR